MDLRKTIAAELPHLRRYTRAILGSQEAGDTVVKAALRTFLEELSSQADGHLEVSGRIALFRAVLAQVDDGDTEATQPDTMIANENIVGAHLRHLHSKPREALLLSVLEGFPVQDIALIMETDVETVSQWLEDAQQALVRQPPTRILIIEDEPIIALDISGAVKSRGHEVVGIAQTREQAVEMARATRPELVLADIQLADDSSGVDAANDIVGQIDVPIIFITAYPERLLTGDRPEPAFLISKPFSDRLLQVTISQALHARTQDA